MLGCLSLLVVVGSLCLMPFFLVEIMQTALRRLHLSPEVALLAVMGIFIGSMINVPVYRIKRNEPQVIQTLGPFGPWFAPQFQRVRQDTLIAVNVGGCVVPALIALWQVLHLLDQGGWPVTAMLVAAGVNIAVCYRSAQPVSGVGILMPVFASPITAVLATWLLMMNPEYAVDRAPVAFVAGVAGPIIGADLFHLRDLSRVSVGVLSIGGAGTFDGIVLSSFLAALLV